MKWRIRFSCFSIKGGNDDICLFLTLAWERRRIYRRFHGNYKGRPCRLHLVLARIVLVLVTK